MRDPDKPQAIIDAAIRGFARNGYYNSRVSDIAREAGIASGTIYLYFKTKDEILVTLFRDNMARFVFHQLRLSMRHKRHCAPPCRGSGARAWAIPGAQCGQGRIDFPFRRRLARDPPHPQVAAASSRSRCASCSSSSNTTRSVDLRAPRAL